MILLLNGFCTINCILLIFFDKYSLFLNGVINRSSKKIFFVLYNIFISITHYRRQFLTFVHNSFLKTRTKFEMYGNLKVDLHVITAVPFPIYGQQTKAILAIITVHYALIQTRIIVNVPAITRANILHRSDNYIRDGQRNS